MATVYPSNFLNANAQASKALNVTLEIEGLDFAFGLSKTYKRLVYGEPGVVYGMPGIVYGGLIEEPGVKDYISLDSSLTIQQRIEPEQGRSSTATMTFVLIDKNQEVSQVISGGGGYLPEILGRPVTVRAGFVNTSYPQDYFVVFRGTVSQVVVLQGKVSITVTDGNQRRRQAIFKAAKTKTTSAIDSSQTTIPVLDSSGFYQPIIGPDLTIDPSYTCFIKIDDEWMSYLAAGLAPTQFTVTRGARGTVAAAHDLDADVVNGFEIEGNAIDLALKFMLSGWGGPWIQNIPPRALGTKIDPAVPLVPTCAVLPAGTDADTTYGVVPGDQVIISGSTAGNDGIYTILDIQSNSLGSNNCLILDQPMTLELANPTLKMAFRSQFDTLPDTAGLKLTPRDVDVRTHLALKQLYLTDETFTLRLFVQEQQTGKEFIEREIYFPIGAYSLTRYGRLSVGITKPPIAGASLQFLNVDNVLDPTNMTITRGLNNRRFFNELQFEYDPTDDGKYQYITRALDTDSLEAIGQVTLLPVKASGVRQDLGGSVLATKTTGRLLQRYKRAAFELRMTVNFEVGIQLEAGDVVAVQDNGQLQLLNFDTGVRSLGISLFEVIDRTLDLKTGRISLVLLSGVGGTYTDRFGTIAPSSVLTSGSTSTILEIQDSYGAIFPGAEYDKWFDYVGLPVVVHNDDWSVSGEAVLTGFDPANNYRLILDAALPFTPLAGYIVEVPYYPTDTSSQTNLLYKVVHAFLDPATPVTFSTGPTSFGVSIPNIGRFSPGRTVQVHSPEWTNYSPELTVDSVDTGLGIVTLSGSMGYTPSPGDLVEFTGFADGGGAYRFT